MALCVLSCADQTLPLTGPQEGGLLPVRSTRANTVIVPDSFSVDLDAAPNTQVAMHTFSDPVYAEVWATGSIHLGTNPAAPGYFGPINTTNGPIYAGGSFDSGGGCGLYVFIRYPQTYDTDITASPCDNTSANWKGTVLVQGAGYARRGPAIAEIGRTCDPMPCHYQSGSQSIWIRPLPTQLVFTSTSRFITRAASVTFNVSANPNLMASGGGRPRRVTAWRWVRADPSYAGSDTTKLQLSCSQTAQTCGLPIYENGTMTVDAIVNGVAQSRSIAVVVNGPCPTGDTILDDPVTRAALTAAWQQSNADGPKPLRIERGAYQFDSMGVHVFRLSPTASDDTPCSNANIPVFPFPGDPSVGQHVHPFSIGDTVPPSCNPKISPDSLRGYGAPFGGPSRQDWHRAWVDSLPQVVADKDSIYRIYPYPMDSILLPDSTWKYNPKDGWKTNYLAVPRLSGTCARM